MRKDVECVFGIMKGRFRILKTGIRVHGLLATDRIWLTCCALHNYLLQSDGLNKEWERGVASDYQGELGLIRTNDLEELPSHFRRHEFDMSAMGRGEDVNTDVLSPEQLAAAAADGGIEVEASPEPEGEENALPIASTAIPVNKMRLDTFRNRLVEHFDILFSQNKVTWPSRTGQSLPPSLEIPSDWQG